MKIQVSTDYAVRILQYLHKHKGNVHTAMNIADATDITYPFFIKIARKLKEQGLLVSVQGRNGGYMLGEQAHKVSFYDVFLCIEGELRINSSLKNKKPSKSDVQDDCAVAEFLQELQDKIIAEMSKKTIVELAG